MLFVAVCLCGGEVRKRRERMLLCALWSWCICEWVDGSSICMSGYGGRSSRGAHLFITVCVCECVNECVSLQGTAWGVGGSVKAIVLGSVPCLYKQVAPSDFIQLCMHTVLQHFHFNNFREPQYIITK